MKRIKRTEIVIERDRVVVIRNLQARKTSWCERCGRLSSMVSVDEASTIARTTARAIYQRAENGKTHSTETAEGRLLICLTSLIDDF